jgi:hypothetical protein
VREASSGARCLTLAYPSPCWRAEERRHPTGCEKMGSPTLQTHQDPILLLPWLWFEVVQAIEHVLGCVSRGTP